MRRRLLGKTLDVGWAARASLYPVCTCYFCNRSSTVVPPHPQNDDIVLGSFHAPSAATSSAPSADVGSAALSTGFADNWFCSQCQCWNRVDPNEVGGIASWDHRMADERSNIRSASLRGQKRQPWLTGPQPIGTQAGQSSSTPIFCHACQTNQTLLLSMIANYEDESGGHEELDQEHFDAWRHDLEVRYPPVCADCQSGVEESLRSADQKARALIWNDLLRQRRLHSQSGGVTPTKFKHALPDDRPDQHRRRPAAQRVPVAWYAAGACFALTWYIDVTLASGIRSSDPKFRVLSFALFCSHLGALRWDPTLREQVALTRKNRGAHSIRIIGLEQWWTTLWILAAIRLTHISILAIRSSQLENRNAVVFSASLLPLQAALCFRAFRRLRVELPARISLKSRTVSGALEALPKRYAAPDLDMLSLDGIRTQENEGKADKVEESSEKSADELEDSMDWSPTVSGRAMSTAAQSTRDISSFQLGPQRFFEPVKQTGLEDLLATRLDLSDDEKRQALSHARSSVTNGSSLATPRRTVLIVIMALSMALTAFVALRYPTEPPSLSQTSRTSLFRCFLEQLTAPWHDWWHRARLLSQQGELHAGLWQTHAVAQQAPSQHPTL